MSNHCITGSFGKTESLFNMRTSAKIAAVADSFTNVRKTEGLVDLRSQTIYQLGFFYRDGKKFDFAPGVCIIPVYDDDGSS